MLFLRGADLDDQPSARNQSRPRRVDELVENGKAVRPAVQCQAGLVIPDADRQLVDLIGRDVRRIADDEIELVVRWERAEQIAFEKPDALRDAVLGSVLLS